VATVTQAKRSIIIRVPSATPTPIPAFTPVLREDLFRVLGLVLFVAGREVWDLLEVSVEDEDVWADNVVVELVCEKTVVDPVIER
jgi:hypothetical protein